VHLLRGQTGRHLLGDPARRSASTPAGAQAFAEPREGAKAVSRRSTERVGSRRRRQAPQVGERRKAERRLPAYAREDPLLRVLEQASLTLLQHPLAAQAAFSALLAEGRRFAQTPEGKRWEAVLRRSELVRRGGALWEFSVLNTLEDGGASTLPSALFDAIVQAAGRDDLLPLFEELHERLADAIEDPRAQRPLRRA